MTKYNLEYSKDVQPFRRLYLIFIVMGISSTLILLLSGIGIYHLSKGHIVERAETEAITISQSLNAIDEDLLLSTFNENNFQHVDLNSIQYKELDESLRQFLPPFHIIQVNVFSIDGILAYSTEPGIIGGQVNRGNRPVSQALYGNHSSQIKTIDEAVDLAYESRFDIDVVTTYVPVYNSNHEIAGVFEISQDVTRFRTDAIQAVVVGLLAVSAILLAVFLIAFLVTQIPMGQLEVAKGKIHKLALIDSLTQIYNRYEIINRLEVEASRVIREDGELSIILIDIDNFKKTNADYGHSVGDEVLKKVANTIQYHIRQYDSVGRYGGDEFLIILPNSDLFNTANIAERVRLSIENIEIKQGNQRVPISISAGVAVFSSAKTDIETLIKRADEALYSAETTGRNRVMTDRSPGREQSASFT